MDDFDVGKYVERTQLPKVMARHTSFAVAGALLATQDAGISLEELRLSRILVATGSSAMDFGGILGSADAVSAKGSRGAHARVLGSAGIGTVPSVINQVLRVNGRSIAFSNQCNSGMDAIGYAASLIASGEIDVAICGGTEAPLHRFPLVELRAGELTPATAELHARQARPFDRWRTTGVVGEGCCMFVLEAETSVRKGYSYVAGYGFANDEGNVLCDGMVEASKTALAQAGMQPREVEVINAWGPGHKLVDSGEAAAMRKLFRGGLDDVAVVSIKGAIGTPLGAAPAIQLGAAALGQRFGLIPPTVNWEYADPSCPFNLSARLRAIPHRLTLVNAHGLGAINSSLVLERC